MLPYNLPFVLPTLCGGQTASVANHSSTASVLQVGAAVAGTSSSLASITMTGTVVRDPTVPGRSAEPVSLQVGVDGTTQMSISAASGTIGEVRAAAGRTGSCTTTNDTDKPWITAANCWTSASWVLPTIALAKTTTGSKVVSSLASVTKEGNPALQLTLQIDTTGHSPGAARYITTVSSRTVFLDPMTLLPSSMTYSEHPGNDTFVNIPAEVVYSDYRTVGSVNVPFHIVKKTNGVPVLDISINQATPNN